MTSADRAVSTVVDVSLAVVLVTGAVLVLVGAPTAPPDTGPDSEATHVASAVLASTIAVDAPSGTTLRGSLGTLLADAATDRGRTAPWFVDGVHRAGASVVDALVAPVNVTAVPTDGHPLSIGPTPPPGATVDAVVVAVDDPKVRLVVGTWSR